MTLFDSLVPRQLFAANAFDAAFSGDDIVRVNAHEDLYRDTNLAIADGAAGHALLM